MMSSR